MCMFCTKKYYGLEKIESIPDYLKWLNRDTKLDESELQMFNRLKSNIFKRQMKSLR